MMRKKVIILPLLLIALLIVGGTVTAFAQSSPKNMKVPPVIQRLMPVGGKVTGINGMVT